MVIKEYGDVGGVGEGCGGEVMLEGIDWGNGDFLWFADVWGYMM